MISKKTKLLVAFSIFVTSLGFFIFPVIATTISDQYITQDSSKINSTGYYFQNSKAFVRSIDSVFCRGSSTLDDLYKGFVCDYVCKSTDSDCSDDLQLALNNKGDIYVSSGFYNFVTDVIVYSNTSIRGSSLVNFNISDNFNINTLALSSLENVNFNSLSFYSNLPNVNDGPLFNITGLNNIDNLKIGNIKLERWNNTGIDISTKVSASGEIKNVYIDNIIFNDVLNGIRAEEKGSEREDRVKNFNVKNYYFNNSVYYTSFFGGIGYGLYLNGVNTASLENLWFRKSADGPELYLQRCKNVDIDNLYSIDQHDYAISILDGSRNINANNIFVVNPTNWGLAYVYNTNFVDSTKNIKLSNLFCLNCSGNGQGQPTIYIHANKDNQNPLENVEISNFWINGSNSYGAININAAKGSIKNVYINKGYIGNVNEAGIIIFGNVTENLVIQDLIIDNAGLTTSDNDKKSGITFYTSNASNVLINNVKFINNSKMLYSVRATTNSFGFVRVLGSYIQGNLPYISLSTTSNMTYYVPQYTYSSISTLNCGDSLDGNTIHNLTASCTCVGGSWKCWAIA